MHTSMNSTSNLKKRNNRGFTLIELAIVIVIIGILSGVASISYVGYVRDAKITEAIHGIQLIVKAEKMYFTKHGEWCVVDEYPRRNRNKNDGSENLKLFQEKLGVDIKSNYWHYRVNGNKRNIYVVAYANQKTNPSMYSGDISFRVPRPDGKYPGYRWPGSYGYGCWRRWINPDELPVPRRRGYQ